jgi:RNA polymerase I specific transcription initiation factor RRN3
MRNGPKPLRPLKWPCTDVSQEEGQAAGVWATLMGALDRALLPTQRSKFTQFLLFYAARQVRLML